MAPKSNSKQQPTPQPGQRSLLGFFSKDASSSSPTATRSTPGPKKQPLSKKADAPSKKRKKPADDSDDDLDDDEGGGGTSKSRTGTGKARKSSRLSESSDPEDVAMMDDEEDDEDVSKNHKMKRRSSNATTGSSSSAAIEIDDDDDGVIGGGKKLKMSKAKAKPSITPSSDSETASTSKRLRSSRLSSSSAAPSEHDGESDDTLTKGQTETADTSLASDEKEGKKGGKGGGGGKKNKKKKGGEYDSDEDYFDDDFDPHELDDFLVPDDFDLSAEEEEESDFKSKSKSKSKSQSQSKSTSKPKPKSDLKGKGKKKSDASDEEEEEEKEEGGRMSASSEGEGGVEGLERWRAGKARSSPKDKNATPRSSSPVATKKSTKPSLSRKAAPGAYRGTRPGAASGSNPSLTNPKDQPFSFLINPLDADQHPPEHPDYDPRTLYIPPKAWKVFTPFEKQFWEIKKDHWDVVLFFQKGKFYELYEDDAGIGHREFDLKMTDRVKMRMVGVPEGQFDHWASKFLAKGYKVGRVDQSETAIGMGLRQKDDNTGKGKGKGKAGGGADDSKIVRRELKMVLTTGTIVDGKMLTEEEAVHCIAIKEHANIPGRPPTFGVCILDAPTAEINMSQFEDDINRTKLETVMRRLRTREIISEKGNLSSATMRVIKGTVPVECQWTNLKKDEEFLSPEDTLTKLEKLFTAYNKTDNSDDDENMEDIEETNKGKGKRKMVNGGSGVSLPDALIKMKDEEFAMSALGGILGYTKSLNLEHLITAGNFNILDPLRQDECLVLDGQTLAHIEVLQNSLGGEEGTLLRLLSRCSTPFGKRLFRLWLCHPLQKIDAINERLDAVDDLIASNGFEIVFSKMAKGMPDLERLISRVHAKSCQPKDFLKVLNGFEKIGQTGDSLLDLSTEFKSKRMRALLDSIPNLEEKVKEIREMFTGSELEPVKGAFPDFDNAVSEIEDVEEKFDPLLKQYRKDLGLSKDKIAFVDKGTNDIKQVEVPLKTKVPKDWVQMSTTKAVKRYWPPEIAELVQELKEGQDKKSTAIKAYQAIVYETFSQSYKMWLTTVRLIAEADCLLSLAKSSQSLGEPCVRPELVESEGAYLEFEELRHPCIIKPDGDFIPNDIRLGGKNPNMILLTGPNMAGKSTLLRMACTGAILAQLGCYVPASKAVISPLNKINTRMGANDLIFQNSSTFKVEMDDAKKILTEATPKSLVILDELGRGTSTHDGVAIAYSVLHRLATHVGCIGFFATHYTSLVRDFAYSPRVRACNMQTMLDEETNEVIFLYKLVEGVCSSSYGALVGKMAGLPEDVVVRAQQVSAKFERQLTDRENSIRRHQTVPLALQADLAYLHRELLTNTPSNVAKKARDGENESTVLKSVGVLATAFRQGLKLAENGKAKNENVDDGMGAVATEETMPTASIEV